MISNSNFSRLPRERTSWLLILLLLYFAWLFTTPYNSPRLGFLATIRFERILAALFLVAALFAGRMDRIFAPIPLGVFALFFWMIVASLVSPFQDYSGLQHWRSEYWKLIILFFCAICSLKKPTDLRKLAFGLMVVVLLYQLLSWKDFMLGGSYVWQQGMKRMTGAWSGGGLGAANGWGAFSAFSLPIATFIYRYKEFYGNWPRFFAAVCFILCWLSIIFSGTRGALIVGVFYSVFVLRKVVFRPRVLIGILIVSLVAMYSLPQDVKERYWDQLFFSADSEADDKGKQVALHSRDSRIKGLTDGFLIANMWPMTGCGPGASAIARELVHEESSDSSDSSDSSEAVHLQLHNLYGQTVGELGYPGFFLGAALVLATLLALVKHSRRVWPESSLYVELRLMLAGQLFVMIAYGMVGHTLYSEKWLLVFSMVACFATACAEDLFDEQVVEFEDPENLDVD